MNPRRYLLVGFAWIVVFLIVISAVPSLSAHSSYSLFHHNNKENAKRYSLTDSQVVAKNFARALIAFENVQPYVTPELYRQIGNRVTPSKKPTITEIQLLEGKEYGGYRVWLVAVSVGTGESPGVEQRFLRVYIDPATNRVAKYEVLY